MRSFNNFKRQITSIKSKISPETFLLAIHFNLIKPAKGINIEIQRYQMRCLIAWAISMSLLVFFFISIIANIQIFMTQIKRKSPEEQAPSFILVAGGIAGAIGLFICPYQPVHYFFWVPPVIDIATVPAIAFVAVTIYKVKHFLNKSK